MKTYKVILIISDNSCKKGWKRHAANFTDPDLAAKFIDDIIRRAAANDGTYFVHTTMEIKRETEK